MFRSASSRSISDSLLESAERNVPRVGSLQNFMSMYVKVKRQKTTIFLMVEATDTIGVVKQKLDELIQQSPDTQRLFKDGAVLEGARTLADQGIESGDVLALVYQSEDGKWEAVDITPLDGTRDGGRAYYE